MDTYSLSHQPPMEAIYFRKPGAYSMKRINEPFCVETKDGLLFYSKELYDDWEEGYWLVYPPWQEAPFAISNAEKERDYVAAVPA